MASGTIWRLIDPDLPFYGTFEQVPKTFSNWKRIHGFKNNSEFEQFQIWIEKEIEIGEAEEIHPKSSDKGHANNERWYKHRASGEIWRLLIPIPPFKGSFYLMN